MPEHKGVQVHSTEQLLEDGSVGKAVQYATSIPQMLSLQGFDTPKFLLFLNKIIESILRTSDLWQNMRGSQRSKLLGNVWSLHVIGISKGGGGVLRINPFCGGGMDNLWSHTIWIFGHYFQHLSQH